MTITAEGIETDFQLASMQQHGCNEIQGYFFSKPLPVGALVLFMDQVALRDAA